MAIRDRRRMADDEFQPLNREQKRILSWLRKVRFRRQFFGVSERDVWKKLEELNNMYNLALIAERARYDSLLAAAGIETGSDTNPQDRGGR